VKTTPASPTPDRARPPEPSTPATRATILVLAWLAVGLPLLWGVGQTISKAAALFR
jgi:hypothetical protein